MTETTDKLTLQQLKDVRELCLPKTAWRSIIDELISARDQLEAERQRADAADSRLHEVSVHCANVEAELAAIRGKQEPVGKFVFEPSGQRWHHIKHGEYQHSEPKLPMVKLFTNQPKPVVVLPKEFFTAKQNVRGMFELSDDCMCGITASMEAAGIVVKDGE